MPNLFEDLPSHGSAPAIIATEGSVSYQALFSEAKRISAEIGSERRVVFLEASNTVDSIIAYVACLVGRHPVYLYSPQDFSRVAQLIDLYSPNSIFSSVDGVLTLRNIHDEVPDLHPELSVLLSTSGSTGSPKLVKLSRGNVHANARSIVEYLRLDSNERAILSLKFNYSYGMSVVNSHFLCGGSLILTDDSVLDDNFWRTFKSCRASSLAGVPYTFETLFRSDENRFETPHLRYMTQAGGRLSPDLVRHFAQRSYKSGWRFYVMYGQTEAAPRMAYLPPEHAAQYPDCIGIPVPGGRIFLLDDNGKEVDAVDTPGELAYSGPNVMLGYARDRADLATDVTPPYLLTGDIACRNDIGLYYVTGRRSRFVKPFGIRINLDEVEAQIRSLVPGAVCAGASERIVIAMRRDEVPPDLPGFLQAMSASYGLPGNSFQTLTYDDDIPRLLNGKTDFASIAEKANQLAGNGQAPDEDVVTRLKHACSILGSRAYPHQVWLEFLQLLGLGAGASQGIASIFASLLPGQTVSSDSTFTGLAGDSLSYVQASLAIEEYLGMLPAEWERMTVTELEQLRGTTSHV